jgi:hypothetical protein
MIQLRREDIDSDTVVFARLKKSVDQVNGGLQTLSDEIGAIIKDIAVATAVAQAVDSLLPLAAKYFS